MTQSLYKCVKYLKVEWLKNNTEKCGAMKECINNTNDDKKNVIWHNSKTYGNMWATVNDKDLLRLTKNDNGIYEVIYKYPHKVYFDIDADEKDYDILKKITPKINELFENADVAISGSKGDIRQSYHIVLNNYLIKNDDDRQTMKALVKHLKNTFDDSFDECVYSKNRNMKCINQSKGDGRIQEIKKIKDDKKHFINTFINIDKSLNIPTFNNDIKLEIEIEKVKNKRFDLGLLPKLTLEYPLNFDIMKFEPLEVLKILPLDKSFKHEYTHYIARYCYNNNICFEDFYKWYKNKNDSVDAYNKWVGNWLNISKFPKVETHQIKTILIKFYPKLYNNSHYNKFEDMFKIGDTIKLDTLSQDIFNTDVKFTNVNTGMGSGKTYQTIKYLQNKQNFIWITPNIALAQNTTQRLRDDNINVSYYKDINNKNEIKNKDKLIICINSLIHACNNYEVVVIDEIETVLNRWFNNDTLTVKNNCWDKFIKILNNAKKVIFLDAFTSNITINFIKHLDNPTYEIYELHNTNVNRTINMINNFENWMGKIITDLICNNKLFIYYPYKDGSGKYVSMEALKNIFESQTDKKGICYHSEADDSTLKTLENVNKHWSNADFVITNNKINVGVNYEKCHFDSVYLSIAGFNSPRDIIQVSYRCRQLNTNNIYMCYVNTKSNNIYENDCKLVNDCEIYKSLASDILIEKISPLKETFNMFCNLAHYKISKDEQDIDEELTEYVKAVLDNVEIGYTYNTIQSIDEVEMEILTKKVLEMKATMDDKLMLKKYYFNKQFVNDKDEHIERLWDDKFIDMITQIKKLKYNDLFEQIKEYNKWSCIFPENEEFNKCKLDDNLRTRIFKEFHLTDLTIKSSASVILKNIYNKYFKKQIITSNKKHQNNLVVIDDASDVYDICMNNLKMFKKTEAVEMIDEDEEEP